MRNENDMVSITTSVSALKMMYSALVLAAKTCDRCGGDYGLDPEMRADMLEAAGEISELLQSPFESSDAEAAAIGGTDKTMLN